MKRRNVKGVEGRKEGETQENKRRKKLSVSRKNWEMK